MNKWRAEEVKKPGQDHIANKQGPRTPTKFFLTTKYFLSSRLCPNVIQCWYVSENGSLVALWFCFHSEWENETKHCLLTQTECVLQETRTPQACVCQAPSSSNKMASRCSRGAPLETEFGYWDNQWIFFQSNKSDEKLLPGAQEPVYVWAMGEGEGGWFPWLKITNESQVCYSYFCMNHWSIPSAENYQSPLRSFILQI